MKWNDFTWNIKRTFNSSCIYIEERTSFISIFTSYYSVFFKLENILNIFVYISIAGSTRFCKVFFSYTSCECRLSTNTLVFYKMQDRIHEATSIRRISYRVKAETCAGMLPNLSGIHVKFENVFKLYAI